MILIAEKLERVFGEGAAAVHALDGVDLCLQEGEFVAIMGKSGAGKSTLLYQLSALDHPTKGKIIIDGAEITTMTERERTKFRLENLGYVFQDYALVPELTAAENVMLPLIMRGIDFDEAVVEAEEVLTRFELGARVGSLPSQLSGGEQQRVAIARSIVHKPKILFADEPTASLDTATSEVVLSYLEELHQNGQTIVMITHEEEYSKRAKRIIEMEDGKILSDVQC